MKDRKKNPPPRFEHMDRPKRKKKRRSSSEVLLGTKIKNDNYRDHAKALRESHLFGELFRPIKGVDFRSHSSTWSASTKRRVTMYWQEMAPRLSGDYVVKRYYKKGRLAAASEASLQGKLLPGQKAVAFSVDKNQSFEIKISKKNRVTVIKGGLADNKIMFDKDALQQDADAELQRVLGLTDAKVFKIITGKNESSKGYTRSALITQVKRWIVQYAESDKEDDIRKYDEWLDGLIVYPDLTTIKPLASRTKQHEKEVKQRDLARLRQLAKSKKPLTKAQLKRIRATGKL